MAVQLWDIVWMLNIPAILKCYLAKWQATANIAIQENINSINKRCPTKIMIIKNIKFYFTYYQFIGLLQFGHNVI